MSSPRDQAWNLFSVLARTHLRSSDYRSFLGALWSFLGPFLTFAVLYLIFTDRLGRNIPYFPLKLLSGVILITFFKSVVQVCMQAVRQSRGYALDTLVPSEIPLLASLTVPCLKFLIEMFLCALISISLGRLSPLGFLGFLFYIPVFIVLALGVGLFLGSLNALASDISELWNALSHLLIFLSPIFYSFEMLSDWARIILYWFNPISSFVMAMEFFLTQAPDPHFETATLLLAVTHTIFWIGAGYTVFKKLEKQILES